ncbi:MAG: alpha-L-arabinofuranosidase [Bacteroidales bacterium]|nr:alpha-L-arabinofuranosidase [Bacteroidales bacterium]
MKRKVIFIIVVGLFVAFTAKLTAQQVHDISVDAGSPLFEIQPVMWGVFFEDINFAADGGVYGELVKNRSFEFTHPMTGWEQVRQNAIGRVVPTFYSPANHNNPHYVVVHADAAKGAFGISNQGFRGMGIRKDNLYNLSVNARISSGSGIRMKAELISSDGTVIGTSEILDLTRDWKKHEATMTSSATDPSAKLQLLFMGLGSVDLDMVSLFPADTWKGRPGGLRKDLVQMIADLKPGFLRFPGGCIVEGRNLENRYQWKLTTGPVEERKLITNRWNSEMRNRPAPDYFQSFGLGFYEYFLMAEDMGAEPLPILNCGMSCQFNAGEVVPLNELQPYIQDALDLIEFANGPVTSKWGALRASMGHPESFNLRYLGVGNEQWEQQYIERYRLFEKEIRLKYPEIKIVSGSGPYASGAYFDLAWTELRKLDPALIDEHYYMAPEWFLNNAGRYDNYDRSGIKVFAGEYAAHGKEGPAPESRNTWLSALTEAAFMTGLERNADVVHMASYAPLLAHVDAWQWRPDLIWFDNLNVIGTPNYYVQKLFSTHRGTHVIPALKDGDPLTGQDSLYVSAVTDKASSMIYVKIVNVSGETKQLRLNFSGASLQKDAEMETLKARGLYDYNSIANPKNIYPFTRPVTVSGKKLQLGIEASSVNVLKLSVRK